MKKLLFILALFPTLAFAEAYLEKEEPMPPIWMKKQPGTSATIKTNTENQAEPMSLVQVLDPNAKQEIKEDIIQEKESDNIFSSYVALKLGYGQYKSNASVAFAATPGDNQKSSYSAGTAVMSLAYGVRLNNFRIEAEGKADTGSKDKGLFGHDTINGKLYTAALMGNVYYDIPLKSKFRPYVGAGVGAAYVKGDLYNLSKSTTNLAWQVMAGIGYDLTEHWKLDLGYNYVSYGDLKIGKTADIDVQLKDIEGHNITLGTRYEF